MITFKAAFTFIVVFFLILINHFFRVGPLNMSCFIHDESFHAEKINCLFVVRAECLNFNCFTVQLQNFQPLCPYVPVPQEKSYNFVSLQFSCWEWVDYPI